MALRLVVGLGNPGPEYERTRHNVGFRLADRLAAEGGRAWKDFRGLGVFARWDGDAWVAKPMTYMNESGRFVQAFAGYHRVPPADILVVYDEIALPLGRIRLRPGGSAGGQKGMGSILRQLATQEIPRLRLGIGPQPERMDSADFVLSRFKPSEEEALESALALAADAARAARRDGLEAAMNRFNPAP